MPVVLFTLLFTGSDCSDELSYIDERQVSFCQSNSLPKTVLRPVTLVALVGCTSFLHLVLLMLVSAFWTYTHNVLLLLRYILCIQ